MGSSARSKYIVLLVQGAEATPEAAFRENTECIVERLETTTLLGLPEELDPGDLGQAVPAREPTQALHMESPRAAARAPAKSAASIGGPALLDSKNGGFQRTGGAGGVASDPTDLVDAYAQGAEVAMAPAVVAAVFPHMQKALASAVERVAQAVVQELLAKFESVVAEVQDRVSAQAQLALEEQVQSAMEQMGIGDGPEAGGQYDLSGSQECGQFYEQPRAGGAW